MTPTPVLSDREIETIYAAYESVIGFEAKTIEGKRRIVEPIYESVILTRLATARALASAESGDEGLCICGARDHRGECHFGWHNPETCPHLSRSEWSVGDAARWVVGEFIETADEDVPPRLSNAIGELDRAIARDAGEPT